MKKILVLFLVVFTAFSLVGCNTSSTSNGVKTIDIQLTEESYAYVVKKGNTKLVDDFNAFLETIKENGTFANIVAKYFEDKGEKKGFEYLSGANASNDENTFVVATNCPFQPFEYVGTDGLMYGIDIEIAQAYAESKNLTLVVKNIDFDAIFENVTNGYADIGMAGITITSEREELYDFTNTYYEASQKLVVAADNSAFDNCMTAEEVETVLASLENVKIGYQIGTTGNWYVAGDADWGFEGFTNITPTGYKTAQLAIQDIVNGQLYAVVVDEAPAEAMVKAINAVN